MKKKTISNPLKTFNDNKAKAYMKAGSAMKAFKKSLPKADEGKQMGPQNNYWFNSPEKRAMSDAQHRFNAAGERSNNYSEEAQRDYGNLIKNYQPQGPALPLADQVAALNKKYEYYDNIMETPFKGGDNNKGWDEMYKRADRNSYAKERAMKDPYSNVGTGLIKKNGGPMKKTLMKAQDGKIVKSKKVRTADINTFGPSTTSVSKTKRDGSTVTKSVNTNQGYVPSASKTKTVTDKSGKSTTTTKDIDWNKALKKQERMTKRVGRNPNDQLSGDNYKKGGIKKPNTTVKPEPSPFQNMRRNILTKRINNLDNKGIESQIAGNKEKAFRQFDKSDKLHEKRAKLREKAGYMKGGVVKKKKK